ncbi:hypothetical protein ACIA49_14215 [Kribbella sp. NPDC051587]|uniref:hypothetical protein n=1 Tax=Kribbella sp. NPDC051587 TaxID=3364119 RepID=UPI0037AE82DC
MRSRRGRARLELATGQAARAREILRVAMANIKDTGSAVRELEQHWELLGFGPVSVDP